MINHQVDAQKLIDGFIEVMRENTNKPRMSLLDAMVFLKLNAEPELGKNDLYKLLVGPQRSKSYLDRPIERLMEYGFIEGIHNDHAATRSGDSRTHYKISLYGKKFLKKCTK